MKTNGRLRIPAIKLLREQTPEWLSYPETQWPDRVPNPVEQARLAQLARLFIARVSEVRLKKVAALKEALQQGAYRLEARILTNLILPGLLAFNDRQEHPLDHLGLATLLADYPALIPEYLTFLKKDPHHFQESIKILLRTLEARDPYAGWHSARVTAITLGFADHLGVPPQERQFLKTGGYLHDLGKVAISKNLLLKPGALTKGERACIETHPSLGDKILEPLDLRPQEKDLILYHHERWDGKGYPHGLAGEEIPFRCRLLSLADVFEALTSERSHRPPRPLDEALTIIEAQAGTQFDPDLAREFIKLAPYPGA